MCGIEEYLNENFKANKTRITYRAILNGYFQVIGEPPETYFKNGRKDEDFLNDLKKYINTSLSGRPSKTCLSYISAVRTYMRHNKVKLDPEDIKTIIKRNKGMGSNRPLTKDRPPSYVEIRQILTHGETVEKTFYLCLLSSGMRIGELCGIKIQNVYMNENPVRIDIPSTETKNGQRRTTFISNEAKNFLIEWFKVRQGYMQLVNERTKNLPTNMKMKITDNDNRVFPFSALTAWKRWGKMCKRAGFTERDTQTNRAVLHPHGLRKFFRTHMGTKIGVDFTEEILGHSGYLVGEYRIHTDRELGDAYLTGMGTVTVFEREIAQDLTNVNEQLKERNEEIKELQVKVANMEREREVILGLRRQMEELIKPQK